MNHRFRTGILSVAFVAWLFVGCSSPRSGTSAASEGRGTVGMASYYSEKYHGKKTASGEVFDMHRMTAAHRTLPFGQQVRVTNLANNRSVQVVINDRGPFVKSRIIDVSLAAARKLDMIRAGTAKVRVEALGR